MTCVPNNLATQIFKGVTLNSTPKLSVEKPKLLKLAKAIVSKYHSKIGGGGSKYERTPKISNLYSFFSYFLQIVVKIVIRRGEDNIFPLLILNWLHILLSKHLY